MNKSKKIINIFIIIEIFFIITNYFVCIAFPDRWNYVEENYNPEPSDNQYIISYYNSMIYKYCLMYLLIIVFTIIMLYLYIRKCKKQKQKANRIILFIGIVLIILLIILIFFTLNPIKF